MSRPQRIFVLTGAGVSAESGLGTFRDRGGLWNRFDPMTLATPEAFARDPAAVHAFYNLRRCDVISARPNPAHLALAHLERETAKRGGRLVLCTQNVDDLHERAGSRTLIHMHGEILKACCLRCATAFICRDDLASERACPGCGEPGGLRPDIVWFGEVPKHLDAIDAALASSDLFVAIGTSGAVYPAAGLVAQAHALGIRTCELNLERSDTAHRFDAAHYGPASRVVPAFVERVLA